MAPPASAPPPLPPHGGADCAAVRIQLRFRQNLAKSVRARKMKAPSPAYQVWNKVKENETIRERVLELDRLKAVCCEQAKRILAEKTEVLRILAADKKAFLRGKIERFAERRIAEGVEGCRLLVTGMVIDPFMPYRLQTSIEAVIACFWPDVQEEVVSAAMNVIRKPPVVILEASPAGCGCCSPVLARLRYFLYPYDKSGWQQLRSPGYILYKLGCLVPVYGVPQVIFLCHLLIIDREDEYQLISYVLAFKSLLFVTLGIVGSAVASVQYYMCFQDITGVNQNPACSSTAPREPLWVLGLFALQVVMVWIAFAHLKSSRRKGGWLYLKEKETAALDESDGEQLHRPAAAHAEREEVVRRRLLKWLVYDVAAFLLCLGLCAAAAFVGPNDEKSRVTREGWTNWRFEAALYMIKCLYGLLSFPFVLLKIPVVSSLLTHAKATAYTRSGQCVPFIGLQGTSTYLPPRLPQNLRYWHTHISAVQQAGPPLLPPAEAAAGFLPNDGPRLLAGSSGAAETEAPPAGGEATSAAGVLRGGAPAAAPPEIVLNSCRAPGAGSGGGRRLSAGARGSPVGAAPTASLPGLGTQTVPDRSQTTEGHGAGRVKVSLQGQSEGTDWPSVGQVSSMETPPSHSHGVGLGHTKGMGGQVDTVGLPLPAAERPSSEKVSPMSASVGQVGSMETPPNHSDGVGLGHTGTEGQMNTLETPVPGAGRPSSEKVGRAEAPEESPMTTSPTPESGDEGDSQGHGASTRSRWAASAKRKVKSKLKSSFQDLATSSVDESASGGGHSRRSRLRLSTSHLSKRAGSLLSTAKEAVASSNGSSDGLEEGSCSNGDDGSTDTSSHPVASASLAAEPEPGGTVRRRRWSRHGKSQQW